MIWHIVDNKGYSSYIYKQCFQQRTAIGPPDFHSPKTFPSVLCSKVKRSVREKFHLLFAFGLINKTVNTLHLNVKFDLQSDSLTTGSITSLGV